MDFFSCSFRDARALIAFRPSSNRPKSARGTSNLIYSNSPYVDTRPPFVARIVYARVSPIPAFTLLVRLSFLAPLAPSSLRRQIATALDYRRSVDETRFDISSYGGSPGFYLESTRRKSLRRRGKCGTTRKPAHIRARSSTRAPIFLRRYGHLAPKYILETRLRARYKTLSRGQRSCKTRRLMRCGKGRRKRLIS